MLPKLNLLKMFSNKKRGQEKCNMVMTEWKAENLASYEDFLKRIDAVTEGDMSVIEDIVALARECVPDEVTFFYEWFIDLLYGKASVKDLDSGNLRWAGEYTEIVAQALTDKKLFIGVDVYTAEAKLYREPVKGLVMIQADTPSNIWNRLPVGTKAQMRSVVDRVWSLDKKRPMTKADREQLYLAFAFFSKMMFLVHATFMGGFLARLFDIVMTQKRPLAYCTYYFVMFDHGLTRMAKILDSILTSDDVDAECLLAVRSFIKGLTVESIALGAETKESWDRTADQCCDEVYTEIAGALRNVKAKRGNKQKIVSLDELLVGDKDALKKKIEKFLSQNTEAQSLAYLLVALQRAKRIKAIKKYTTFHRAISKFAQREYGIDVPQRRYSYLQEITLSGDVRGHADKKAKAIIDKWTAVFAKCC